MSNLIKSTSYDQTEILRWIMQLCNIEQFDVDPTYSKGNFYKKGIPQPRLKYDISPVTDDTIQADCCNLPLDDNSMRSIVFDPPFLATTSKNLYVKNRNNIMVKRFGVFPTEKELHRFYIEALKEFNRVLKDDGWLIFKCQDKVSAGQQYFSHVFVCAKAIKLGFYPKDLFVLLSKNRLVAKWQRNQQHARKFHSYFWVFQKNKKRIKYM